LPPVVIQIQSGSHGQCSSVTVGPSSLSVEPPRC
jgi:hypothetical protein